MDKRSNIRKQKTSKRLRRFLISALILAIALPYSIIKICAHRKAKAYTSHDLSLPQLQEDPDNPKINGLVKSKDNQWQIIKPRSGDSMATIFNRLGLSAKNLQEVIHNNPHAKLLTAIKTTQELRFLIIHHQLNKLIVPVNNMQTLTVYRSEGIYKTQIDYKKTTSQNNYVTATVKGSLSSTAQNLNIPYKLIRQMTTIFNKQIDFSRSIRTGDQFSMVYEAFYVDDKLVATGDILALTYTNKGNTFRAIRHTHANGDHEFYTPEGTSFKKAFSRYPVQFSHISSTFSLSRMHPILHYRRAHKGIDLAASIGTPIRSIGDGHIEVIGRHSGYGNMIKIHHDQTYSTVYGHMLRFQKGLSKGSRVKKDQVIGYVGQTGLASGPHCHFEIHVKNQPRNPTTIPLPTAASIPSRELASFKANANTLLARLKLYEEANLAAAGKRNVDTG